MMILQIRYKINIIMQIFKNNIMKKMKNNLNYLTSKNILIKKVEPINKIL
jgi:hypothetical protein